MKTSLKTQQKQASISAIAAHAGLDRRTVADGLRRARLPSKRKGAARLFNLDAALVALEAGDGLRSRLLRERIRKLEIENDSKQKLVVSRQAVADAITRVLGRAREILETQLVHVYPSQVAGKDVPTVRTLGRKLNDSILEQLSVLGEEFSGL
jgi:hypothetical protein